MSITFCFGSVIYILFLYIDEAKQIYFATLSDYELEHINRETFFSYYKINKKSDIENFIIMLYYSFTTLSTIGFGDYHPVSDEERIIVVCGLLFGVMIFSFSMGVFIQILQNFQMLHVDLDDGDELEKFFGLIKSYNNG